MKEEKKLINLCLEINARIIITLVVVYYLVSLKVFNFWFLILITIYLTFWSVYKVFEIKKSD